MLHQHPQLVHALIAEHQRELRTRAERARLKQAVRQARRRRAKAERAP